MLCFLRYTIPAKMQSKKMFFCYESNQTLNGKIVKIVPEKIQVRSAAFCVLL